MSSDKQVDYAFILGGEPVAFVEAKGADSTITDYNVGQLGDYMQKEWADFGLLTNGKQFIALKLEPSEGGPPEIIRMGSVELDQLGEKRWLQPLFSGVIGRRRGRGNRCEHRQARAGGGTPTE